MYISVSEIKRDTFMYIIQNLILYILAFVTAFGCLKLKVEMYKKIVIIIILMLLCINCLLYIKRYIDYNLRESYLRKKGIRIEASFNQKEFVISYNRIRYCYKFVAYYTEGKRTYIFREDMLSFQTMMNLNIEKMKKEGIIPDKITVLVDPNDYNKYIMLKYNFLNEMYSLNREIVESYIR